jgi:hypothetical protein
MPNRGVGAQKRFLNIAAPIFYRQKVIELPILMSWQRSLDSLRGVHIYLIREGDGSQ